MDKRENIGNLGAGDNLNTANEAREVQFQLIEQNSKNEQEITSLSEVRDRQRVKIDYLEKEHSDALDSISKLQDNLKQKDREIRKITCDQRDIDGELSDVKTRMTDLKKSKQMILIQLDEKSSELNDITAKYESAREDMRKEERKTHELEDQLQNLSVKYHKVEESIQKSQNDQTCIDQKSQERDLKIKEQEEISKHLQTKIKNVQNDHQNYSGFGSLCSAPKIGDFYG